MFDRMVKNIYPQSTINATVTEVRAPTDDSLRLLFEMEEKITKSIVSKIRIENNIFSGLVVVFRDSSSFGHILRFRVLLNGEEFTGELHIGDDPLDQASVYRSICERVAKIMTEKILAEFFLRLSTKRMG